MTHAVDNATALESDLLLAVASGLEPNFERWLRFVGWRPGTWIELQALGVPGRYGDRVTFAHADTLEDATSLLRRGDKLLASGVYTIGNVINPAVATRATPRQWNDAKKGSSTSDRDITHRRVIFLDVDSRRPSGTSATAEELAHTVPVALAIRAWLGSHINHGAVGYGASGNGRQVFIALEETPESPELAAIVKNLVVAIAKRFSTPNAPIDATVCDAKRLVPAFGTTKRKGAAGIAERPHRATGFTCAESVERVDVPTLEALILALERELGDSGPPSRATPLDDDDWDNVVRPKKRERFARANGTPIAALAEALGIAVDGTVTCPGCKNTSGVALVGNGLKCHHQSCASKGAPSRSGFRTPVDLVAEVQSITPREAAAWILERFHDEPRETESPTQRYEPDGLDVPPAGFAGRKFALTDLGNAERFVAHHGADIRHCHEWKQWLVWDDARWSVDRRGDVDLRAIQTVRAIKSEAREVMRKDKDAAKAVFGHAKSSEGAKSLSAMVKVARALPGVPVVPEQLDRDPWLFNCANGTIDLRSGALRPHHRDDNITKVAPVTYDAAARAPLWEKFLLDIMGNDQELVAFLQRAVGYSLTGCVNEQVIFFLHGGGANGKSTFLRTLLELVGDYGRQSAPDVLVAKRNESHPTEIADLFGARLVVCQEMDAGRALAEATVKKLTGSDIIKARRMHQDFWSFAPTHKFFLAANHKPRVSGTDEAIWRRMKLVPFDVTIPEERRDGRLMEKLLVERPGILRWAVEGCTRWLADGLRPPAKVVQATEGYRKEEDSIGDFLEECCERASDYVISSADLFRAYSNWCEQNGARSFGRRAFAGALQNHQFSTTKGTHGVRTWLGLRLKAEHAGRAARATDSRDAGDGDGLLWSDA